MYLMLCESEGWCSKTFSPDAEKLCSDGVWVLGFGLVFLSLLMWLKHLDFVSVMLIIMGSTFLLPEKPPRQPSRGAPLWWLPRVNA